MANRSYPPFGKVKTIVLPCQKSIDGMTILEYKEKFGIDLWQLFNWNGANAYHPNEKLKNTIFYLEADLGDFEIQGTEKGTFLYPAYVIVEENSSVVAVQATYKVDGSPDMGLIRFSVSDDGTVGCFTH